MARARRPADKESETRQPHEPDREKRQPYSKEHEDYAGAGVMKPPKEQVGARNSGKPPRKR